MTVPVLHIPQKDSPETILSASILSTDTVIPLVDSSIFQSDNITRFTLGINMPVTETVTIISYNGDGTVNVMRAAQAYDWVAGTAVARVFTAQDLTEIHENIYQHKHISGLGNQIPTAGIVDRAITYDKAGNQIVRLDARQGGHEDIWVLEGTTNWTPGLVSMQVGSHRFSFSIGMPSKLVTVTYPKPWRVQEAPLVFISLFSQSSGNLRYNYTALIEDRFTINVHRETTSNTYMVYLFWMAIGPPLLS